MCGQNWQLIYANILVLRNMVQKSMLGVIYNYEISPEFQWTETVKCIVKL